MLALIYDVETSGLFNKRARPGDECQPDVLQLCAMLCDDERVYSVLNLYVHGERPIPAEATAIHRIDREMTAKVGVSRLRMCQLFSSFAKSADVLVGHNQDFDNFMMRSEMLKEGGNGQLMNKAQFCTMKASTKICKIPHKTPRHPEDYKWPSLQEAYKALVDPRGFDGAHDAFADVTATHEVYRVLRKQPD